MRRDAPQSLPVAGPVTEAILVFEPRSGLGFTRFLRSEFQHCFCLVQHPIGWLVCDPLKHSLALDVIEAVEANELLCALAHNRRTILHLSLPAPTACGPIRLRPLTCVEIVKRLLGIEARSVFTPYQLFRYVARFSGHTGVRVLSTTKAH